MSEERFNKKFSMKAILILVIMIASSLGITAMIFGFMTLISLNNYNELMDKYEGLSGEYVVLQTNYSGILVSYGDINGKYQNLTEDYGDLNETYQDLTEDYSDLNDIYYILTGDYTDLQGDYDKLIINYAKLNIDYNNLKDQFDTLQQEYDELQENHTNLQGQYDELLINYQILQDQYNDLWDNHQILQGQYDELLINYQLLSDDYNDLLDDYNDLLVQHQDLQIQYDTFKTYISTLVLPAQYLAFAEAVRRYYMPLYLENKYGKEYWKASVEYKRDVVLHDSWQENSFGVVSNAFSECLKYGSDTMYLSWIIMYYMFWDWLPNWGGWDLSGDELLDIDTIHLWCIDEINYEWDRNITYDQQSFNWDYIKFPVETAFRTMGDCEDQAILDASYLESCGFETAIATIHDPNHPTYGSFCHGTLLVHIEDTDSYNSIFPFHPLWSLGDIDPYEGSTWSWLDPTWNIRFGWSISWLDDYGGSISADICSIAVCDPDGGVGEPELQCELL